MDTRERLESAFHRDYRIPGDQVDEFVALQRRAAAIYREHALSWMLARSRSDSEDWVEFGPQFREHAALERTAKAFDRNPELLERLAGFERRWPELWQEGGGAVMARQLFIAVGDDASSEADYVKVLEVGGMPRLTDELPRIDQAEMSPAMRLAQALARALARRLDAAVPVPYRVIAEQECVVLSENSRPRTWTTLVDLDVEYAIEKTLEDIQEALTEDLTVPWPHAPARGYAFHEPHVGRTATAIEFRYGSRKHPVLRFEPIPFGELDQD
ncbi:MAG: hypothetical protein QOJ29_2736 [Thermoleophilaceae bacterium]|nr:hypothetical protein [Thermoleophilaceae bacterium]